MIELVSVHDVAAYIVKHFPSGISPMKLQKLSFYSQGWNLALRGEPLFPQEFEAWVNGPVCYDLFDVHRGEWNVDAWPPGNANSLSKKDQVVVDAVLKNFGALSGQELSRMTHEPNTPWSKVRAAEGLGPNDRTRSDIPKNLMQEFFTA